jgi:hypothetical protein
MKRALETIEHFARLGKGSNDTPYLDDTEKLNLMCEYFEIILDCIDGRIALEPSNGLPKEHLEDSYEEDSENYVNPGGGCGCGGNCLCGKES